VIDTSHTNTVVANNTIVDGDTATSSLGEQTILLESEQTVYKVVIDFTDTTSLSSHMTTVQERDAEPCIANFHAADEELHTRLTKVKRTPLLKILRRQKKSLITSRKTMI